LNFNLHTIKIFAVEPSDCAFCGGGIVVGYSSFTFLFSSFAVLVNPDLGFSGAFVVFDHTN